MNIKAQKIELVKMLLSTTDTDLLKKVQKIFEKAEVTGEDITEAKLASIKRGLKQIEKGEVVSHNEVRKIYEKWL